MVDLRRGATGRMGNAGLEREPYGKNRITGRDFLAGVRAEIGQQTVFVAAINGNGRIGDDLTDGQHQLLDQNIDLI